MQSNPNRLFPDCRLKVERAKSHIDELDRVIAEHKTNKPPIVEYADRIGPDGVTRKTLSVIAKAPPPITSAIIGDAIHNLRSALDLMAVRLVELTGADGEDTSFPFGKDEKSFLKEIKNKNFDKASPIDQAELIALRPYNGGDDKLFALHKLNILDKHKRIIPSGVFMQPPSFGVKLDSTGKPVGFDEGKLELEIKPGSTAVVEYTFPKDWPLAESPLIPTLNELAKLVENILDRFESVQR